LDALRSKLPTGLYWFLATSIGAKRSIATADDFFVILAATTVDVRLVTWRYLSNSFEAILAPPSFEESVRACGIHRR
jgi:hypothetical protein